MEQEMENETESGFKLYLPRVKRGTRRKELIKLFSNYGVVVSCNVIRTVGFVYMDNEMNALAAVAALNNSLFKNVLLKVEIGRKKLRSKEKKEIEFLSDASTQTTCDESELIANVHNIEKLSLEQTDANSIDSSDLIQSDENKNEVKLMLDNNKQLSTENDLPPEEDNESDTVDNISLSEEEINSIISESENVEVKTDVDQEIVDHQQTYSQKTDESSELVLPSLHAEVNVDKPTLSKDPNEAENDKEVDEKRVLKQYVREPQKDVRYMTEPFEIEELPGERSARLARQRRNNFVANLEHVCLKCGTPYSFGRENNSYSRYPTNKPPQNAAFGFYNNNPFHNRRQNTFQNTDFVKRQAGMSDVKNTKFNSFNRSFPKYTQQNWSNNRKNGYEWETSVKNSSIDKIERHLNRGINNIKNDTVPKDNRENNKIKVFENPFRDKPHTAVASQKQSKRSISSDRSYTTRIIRPSA